MLAKFSGITPGIVNTLDQNYKLGIGKLQEEVYLTRVTILYLISKKDLLVQVEM